MDPRDNLIPLNKRTKEEVRAIASKGGSVKSPKKTLANKLNAMKRHGKIDEEGVRRYMEILEDPEMNAYDILRYLDLIKTNIDKPYQMIQLADKYIQLMKVHHGEKVKSESNNMNLNLNMDVIKFNELMKRYEKDE